MLKTNLQITIIRIGLILSKSRYRVGRILNLLIMSMKLSRKSAILIQLILNKLKINLNCLSILERIKKKPFFRPLLKICTSSIK